MRHLPRASPYLGRNEQVFPGDAVVLESSRKRSSDFCLVVVAPSWKRAGVAQKGAIANRRSLLL